VTVTGTPWPWKVEAIEFKDNGSVAIELRMSRPEISRRVADMVEAAPEVYEALVGLVALFGFGSNTPLVITKLHGPMTNGDQDKIDAVFGKIMHAVAKTEGSTETNGKRRAMTDWPRIRTNVDDDRLARDDEVEYCEHCGAAVLEGALQRHLGERRCDECRPLCCQCQDWPVSEKGEFCPTCALEAMGVEV
jgi:hypothetical protein